MKILKPVIIDDRNKIKIDDINADDIVIKVKSNGTTSVLGKVTDYSNSNSLTWYGQSETGFIYNSIDKAVEKNHSDRFLILDTTTNQVRELQRKIGSGEININDVKPNYLVIAVFDGKVNIVKYIEKLGFAWNLDNHPTAYDTIPQLLAHTINIMPELNIQVIVP